MTNIQKQMESIFKSTCGTWENCNKTTVLSFLSQCEEQNIDPQYCLNWLENSKEKIVDWSELSGIAQNWVNDHTSTGSPMTMENHES